MGKIIAVVSGKGGTGKTTFTANTALALAAMGQRVLCMDCDVTLRNLDLALGLSDRALMDFSDVLAGRCTLSQAAVAHEKYPTLSLLTAPVADRPLELSVSAVKQLAADIRAGYDWCLIDAPAGLGQGFQMAACMADQVVVITTTDVSIDAAGLPLLGVVPEDEDVPYCLNRGLVLREHNYYAARAYENIAKRIMGQKAPLMKI